MLRLLLRVCVLVGVGGLASAVPAQAAEVHGDNGPLGLVFTASGGEVNDVQVSYSSGSYTIRDSGSTLTPGAFCGSVAPHEVRCTNTGMFAWHNVDVRLGDQDDRATILSVPETDVVHFHVFGEAGDDSARGESKWGGMMWGGDGDDSLELATFAGNGWFAGEGGDDVFRGGAYLDDFAGGEGDDTVVAPSAFDRLSGGAGSDTLDYSGSGIAVTLDLAVGSGTPGAGIDTTFENVLGGSGDDILSGNASANLLDGGDGDDVIDGRFGPDEIVGGDGLDIADYSARTDDVTIVPSSTPISGNDDDGPPADRDVVHPDVEGGYGGAGDDFFVGTAADNFFNGGYGADEYLGSAGYDLVDYSDRTADVTVRLDDSRNSGNDDDGLHGARDLVGADVEDIVGGDGDDTLIGNGLDNFFDGGFGADVLRGGLGNDLVDYSSRSAGVGIFLDGTPRSGNDSDGPAGARDTLDSIEDAIGGDGNDSLSGNAAANILAGGFGDDTLDGGAGKDLLAGEADDDRITSRDGDVDSVFCGVDVDAATVERVDVVAADCESIDQGPPAVGTSVARDITQTSVRLTATVHPNRSPTGAWFELGTTTAYGVRSLAVAPLLDNEDVPVTIEVKGLAAGTTYHVRAAAQNAAGPAYGPDATFTTAAPDVVPPPPPPPPVRCRVPNVKGKSLAAGRRALVRAHCRIGKIRRVYSRTVPKGRILSQSRRRGATLPARTKVGVAVSRGKQPRTRPRRR